MARARSTAARGSRTISASPPPSCSHSDASVAGGSARGLREAVKTTRAAAGSSARSIPAASLSSSTDTTATSRRSPATSGSAAASAAIPDGLWAPSRIVSGVLPHDLQPPGHAHAGRHLGDRAASIVPERARAAASATRKFWRW